MLENFMAIMQDMRYTKTFYVLCDKNFKPKITTDNGLPKFYSYVGFIEGYLDMGASTADSTSVSILNEDDLTKWFTALEEHTKKDFTLTIRDGDSYLLERNYPHFEADISRKLPEEQKRGIILQTIQMYNDNFGEIIYM